MKIFFTVIAAIAVGLIASHPAWAVIGGNSQVFDDFASGLNAFNKGIITVVRALGIASMVAIAIFMIATGKFQVRLFASAAVGLIIAALAKPIVDFLFGG